MIDTPQIVETQAQLTAVIHLNIPRDEMPREFGPAMNELLSTLAAQGIEPKSAAFAYHLRMPPGRFDFELGFVVEDTVAATGRVKASQLPATKVARTIYHGGYEGLHDAWSKFHTWLKAENLKHDEGLWELYAVGPQSTTNAHRLVPRAHGDQEEEGNR
jgi:effector-binding domain-containing protein